jgi:hypothetical protein
MHVANIGDVVLAKECKCLILLGRIGNKYSSAIKCSSTYVREKDIDS